MDGRGGRYGGALRTEGSRDEGRLARKRDGRVLRAMNSKAKDGRDGQCSFLPPPFVVHSMSLPRGVQVTVSQCLSGPPPLPSLDAAPCPQSRPGHPGCTSRGSLDVVDGCAGNGHPLLRVSPRLGRSGTRASGVSSCIPAARLLPRSAQLWVPLFHLQSLYRGGSSAMTHTELCNCLIAKQ
ncbi:hypothetical protein PYCCODRAFT_309962 [Trametes coccinea BRFM310]|uniref:Uncharacterized protein n=1 Tax=Trametes coccinea (strain BRFM310) TaxID=1353009 RepID=A0A1Y2INY8_TRAC3|nr:hypothetical protein PYCCODRAFT_309962 [Trametes coccinea BRFM310]